MSVTLHGIGAFLRISVVVCNFRLGITLRKPADLLKLSRGFELEKNKTTSAGKDGQQLPMKSPRTVYVPLLAPTYRSVSYLQGSTKSRGEGLS